MSMGREKLNINSILVGVVIALQGWILLEIVSLRDRLTKVETKIEWWRGTKVNYPLHKLPDENL